MIYYTSDLHLGHENIITSCQRPFSCIEEMDEALIANWNARVNKTDTVYILGDLIFRAKLAPEAYLQRLKGKKHLIIGNHDTSWLNKVDTAKYFESVSRLEVINTGRGKATLCHFPMCDHEGRWLIHGHIHATTDSPYWHFLRESERTLNAGVDIHGYTPVLFEELFENNLRFKEGHL